MGIEVCRGQRVFRKAVSVIVAAAFFVNYVLPDAWAARDNGAAQTSVRSAAPSVQPLTPASFDLDTFKLPVNFGEIRSTYKGKPGKVVIHLQDAHCNFYAQHRIADIIDHLVKEYGADTINLEGASGKYDLDAFTSISGDDIRREVSEFFMKKGEVNGAEFYAVNNPKAVKLWGVENKDLYLENLKVYRDSLKTKPDADKYLAQVSTALDEFKKKIYSPELLKMDGMYASYKSGNTDFKEYILFLADSAKAQGLDIDKFAGLKTLLKTMAREKDINFERANKERDEVVDEISKWLSLNERAEFASKSLQFKTSKISQKVFYDYLMKKAFALGIGMERFANLKKYAVYIADYEAVDLSKVIDEMDNLEAAINERLCRDDAQRKLNRLSRDLAIMKNIFSISLTKSDYSYYAANKKDFGMKNYIDFAAKAPNGNGKKAVISEDALALDGYREKISAFYECSLKRDDAFLDNMRFTTAPDGTQIAVIMTGGFHSENLWEIFKARGISYISILPKFTPEEKDYLNPYFDLLAGKDSDMEKMLRSVIARSASLQIASKLSAALGEAVWGGDGIAVFNAAVKIEALSREKTVEVYDNAGNCLFRQGSGPVEKIQIAKLMAESGYTPKPASVPVSPAVTVFCEELDRVSETWLKNGKLDIERITVVGSARLTPGTQGYEQAKLLGRVVADRNIALLNGGGPGVMEASAAGAQSAKDSFPLRPSVIVEGAAIVVPYEEKPNDHIRVVTTHNLFPTRKFVLTQIGTDGMSACVGGFGTMDEMFENMTLGKPVGFLGTEFWNPILDPLFEALKDHGYWSQGQQTPLVTDDAEGLADDIIRRGRGIHKLNKHELQTIIDRMKDSVTKAMPSMQEMGESVVFAGGDHPTKITADVAEGLAVWLKGSKTSIRAADQGSLDALNKSYPEGTQGLLLRDPTTLDRDSSAIADKNAIVVQDLTAHRYLLTQNAKAYVFQPGGIEVLSMLYSVLTQIQCKKIPQKPIILIGKEFWTPVMGAVTDALLKYKPSLISSKDLDLFKIVDTVEEARTALQGTITAEPNQPPPPAGGKARRTSVLLPLKALIAPSMPFNEYAVNVAPLIEELIFFFAPLVASFYFSGGSALAMAFTLFLSRVIFVVLHLHYEDIVFMEGIEIFLAGRDLDAEQIKHAHVDWMLLRTMAPVFGIDTEGHTMNKLRAIAMAHNLGSDFVSVLHDGEARGIAGRLESLNIEYIGREPADVYDDLKAKGQDLTRDEKYALGRLDHGAIALRQLETADIYVPPEIKIVIERYQDVPMRDEFETWSLETQTMFAVFVIANAFELDNNQTLTSGVIKDPAKTLASVRERFRVQGYMEPYIKELQAWLKSGKGIEHEEHESFDTWSDKKMPADLLNIMKFSASPVSPGMKPELENSLPESLIGGVTAPQSVGIYGALLGIPVISLAAFISEPAIGGIVILSGAMLMVIMNIHGGANWKALFRGEHPAVIGMPVFRNLPPPPAEARAVTGEVKTRGVLVPAAAIFISLVFLGSIMYSFNFDILKFAAYFGDNRIAYAFYFTSCSLLGHGFASLIDKDRHWSRYVFWSIVPFLSSFYLFWFVPYTAAIVPDMGLWSHFMRQIVDLFVWAQPMVLGHFSIEALRQRWAGERDGMGTAAPLKQERSASATVLDKIRSFYAPGGFATTTALFWMPIGFFTYYGMSDAARLMIISAVSIAFAVIGAFFVAQRPGQQFTKTRWVNSALGRVHLIPAVLAPALAFLFGYPLHALGAIGATIAGYTVFRLWGAFLTRVFPDGAGRAARSPGKWWRGVVKLVLLFSLGGMIFSEERPVIRPEPPEPAPQEQLMRNSVTEILLSAVKEMEKAKEPLAPYLSNLVVNGIEFLPPGVTRKFFAKLDMKPGAEDPAKLENHRLTVNMGLVGPMMSRILHYQEQNLALAARGDEDGSKKAKVMSDVHKWLIISKVVHEAAHSLRYAEAPKLAIALSDARKEFVRVYRSMEPRLSNVTTRLEGVNEAEKTELREAARKAFALLVRSEVPADTAEIRFLLSRGVMPEDLAGLTLTEMNDRGMDPRAAYSLMMDLRHLMGVTGVDGKGWDDRILRMHITDTLANIKPPERINPPAGMPPAEAGNILIDTLIGWWAHYFELEEGRASIGRDGRFMTPTIRLKGPANVWPAPGFMSWLIDPAYSGPEEAATPPVVPPSVAPPAVPGPVPGTHAPALPEGRLFNFEARSPLPAVILPLKNIIAPNLPNDDYAVNVAPWVEEMLFFALPLIGSCFLFNGGILAMIITMVGFRMFFLLLHGHGADIVHLDGFEIFALGLKPNRELYKHAAADFRFIRALADVFIIGFNEPMLNKLRVIAVAHNFEGIFGDSTLENLEKDLVARLGKRRIEYIGRDPDAVLRDLERSGESLTADEKSIVRKLDHGAAAVRALEKRNIYIPPDIRTVIKRHMDVPTADEFASWTDETRVMFCMFVIADAFELDNNSHLHSGATRDPEKTLSSIEKKFRAYGYMQSYIDTLRNRLRQDQAHRPQIPQYVSEWQKKSLADGLRSTIEYSASPILPGAEHFIQSELSRGLLNILSTPTRVAFLGLALSVPVVLIAAITPNLAVVALSVIVMTLILGISHATQNWHTLFTGEVPAVIGMPALGGSAGGRSPRDILTSVRSQDEGARPGATRGVSGIPNEAYSPPIKSAIDDGRFAVVRLGLSLNVEIAPLAMDDGTSMRGQVELSSDDIKVLDDVIDMLSGDERDYLQFATLLFIPSLDEAVRKEAALRGVFADRAPPEGCRGTHYGVARNQYYFDRSLLRDPDELADHMRHEINERKGVFDGLTSGEKGALRGDRPPALSEKINALAEREHNRLVRSELRKGTVIGEWKIKRNLGSGGMGSVYLAERSDGGEPVIIKFVKPDMSLNELGLESHRRFNEQEIPALQRLSHPNIVGYRGHGEWQGTPYLVTQYVKGETLLSKITQNGGLSEKDAVNYAIQILRGISHASSRGVVHRDIKPENILITADGQAVLLDFGIAALDGRDDISRDSGLLGVGTPEYMAPEQNARRGVYEGIDARTDIYSLGCTLYHALTGEMVFPNRSQETILIKHNAAPRPRIAQTSPTRHFNLKLDGIIFKMMQIKKEDRYQTADECLKDFEALASEMGIVTDRAVLKVQTPSRGISGLPNEVYSGPIAEAVAARDFAAVGLGADGRLAPGKLKLDNGDEAAGTLSLNEGQLDTLNSAKDLLAPEDRVLLNDATILFIADLDAKVAKEAARLASEGRAPPESCYGTHYGIARDQYYLDVKLFDDPQELAAHLRHEIEERKGVLDGLTLKEKDALRGERSPALSAKIAALAAEEHNKLIREAELQGKKEVDFGDQVARMVSDVGDMALEDVVMSVLSGQKGVIWKGYNPMIVAKCANAYHKAVRLVRFLKADISGLSDRNVLNLVNLSQRVYFKNDHSSITPSTSEFSSEFSLENKRRVVKAVIALMFDRVAVILDNELRKNIRRGDRVGVKKVLSQMAREATAGPDVAKKMSRIIVRIAAPSLNWKEADIILVMSFWSDLRELLARSNRTDPERQAFQEVMVEALEKLRANAKNDDVSAAAGISLVEVLTPGPALGRLIAQEGAATSPATEALAAANTGVPDDRIKGIADRLNARVMVAIDAFEELSLADQEKVLAALNDGIDLWMKKQLFVDQAAGKFIEGDIRRDVDQRSNSSALVGLRSQVFDIGTRLNLSAHGISADRGGLENMLGIILDGRINSDYSGPLRGGQNNLMAGAHGPFYVVLSSQANDWQAREAHNIYLVPDNEDKDALRGMIDMAVEQHFLDAATAAETLSKTLTYKEFVDMNTTGETISRPEPSDIGRKPTIPPPSRGISGLPNEVYSGPIRKAIEEGKFMASSFNFDNGKFEYGELTLDNGRVAVGNEFTDAQFEALNSAKDLLSSEIMEKFGNAVVLFIPGLDDEVAKETASRAAAQGRAPPANCYGSHYGITRNQYYLDAKLLDNPKELARHLKHEIEECFGVIGRLSEADLATPPLERPQELIDRINGLASLKHADLVIRDLKAGDVIDGWRLERVIGRGAMALVYLAENVSTGQKAALKFANGSVVGRRNVSDETRLFLEVEIPAAERLNHPNIPRYIGHGDIDGVPYLATEDIDGRTLSDVTKDGSTIPQEKAVDYAIQLLGAIEHASSKGVVHRDVKPANVIVTKEEKVYLVDWGLAALDGRDDINDIKLSIGTPAYMPPEQAYCQRVYIDSRSDIYSLGCTLFELLTNKDPFPGADVQATMYKQINADRPSLIAKYPNMGFDPELDRIILKMIQKNPNDRYRTPAECLSDFKTLAAKLAQSPGATAPQSVPPAAAGASLPGARETIDASSVVGDVSSPALLSNRDYVIRNGKYELVLDKKGLTPVEYNVSLGGKIYQLVTTHETIRWFFGAPLMGFEWFTTLKVAQPEKLEGFVRVRPQFSLEGSFHGYGLYQVPTEIVQFENGISGKFDIGSYPVDQNMFGGVVFTRIHTLKDNGWTVTYRIKNTSETLKTVFPGDHAGFNLRHPGLTQDLTRVELWIPDAHQLWVARKRIPTGRKISLSKDSRLNFTESKPLGVNAEKGKNFLEHVFYLGTNNEHRIVIFIPAEKPGDDGLRIEITTDQRFSSVLVCLRGDTLFVEPMTGPVTPYTLGARNVPGAEGITVAPGLTAELSYRINVELAPAGLATARSLIVNIFSGSASWLNWLSRVAGLVTLSTPLHELNHVLAARAFGGAASWTWKGLFTGKVSITRGPPEAYKEALKAGMRANLLLGALFGVIAIASSVLLQSDIATILAGTAALFNLASGLSEFLPGGDLGREAGIRQGVLGKVITHHSDETLDDGFAARMGKALDRILSKEDPAAWIAKGRETPTPAAKQIPEVPPSSRGVSGLDNAVYSPPIKEAILAREFMAAGFDAEKKVFTRGTLRLDGAKDPVEGKTSLTSEQIRALNTAKDFLTDYDRSLLHGVTILFIDGLDDAIAKEVASRPQAEGRAPPESCYGSHYGIQRNQLYFDTKLISDPQGLARHIHHEVRERASVVGRLDRYDLAESASERSLELVARINDLAQEEHRRLVLYDIRPGDVINGQWKIIREAGQGAMSIVYLVEDLRPGHTDQQAAIKVADMVMGDDGSGIRRFLEVEIPAAQKLDHPNIPKYIDHGSFFGTPYLVTEYVEGETLGRKIGSGATVPQKDAVSYAVQVLRALEHASSRGVVHRDVKPENVIITPQGKAVLIDFGLGVLDGTDNISQSGSAVGSPSYMSPEQARGQKSEIDGRTDIHSLGCVLYHILTGKEPFDGDDLGAVMREIVSGDRPSMTKNFPKLGIDPELDAIVIKMMQKDPSDRYRDAAECLKDFEALAAKLGVSVPAAPVDVISGNVQVPTVERVFLSETDLGPRSKELLLMTPLDISSLAQKDRASAESLIADVVAELGADRKELELGELIDSGFFGDVHKDASGEKVIKIISERPGELEDKVVAKKLFLLREALIMIKLNGTGDVPRIFGLGMVKQRDVPDHVGIVMEMGDMSLDKIMLKGKISPGDAEKLALSLARKLDAIHKAGIWHLDIKPDNILVPLKDGAYDFENAMIVDFGLAIDVSDKDIEALNTINDELKNSPIFGSPQYVPYEGTERRFSQRTDVYGLGMVIYALLVGEPTVIVSSDSKVYNIKAKMYNEQRALNPVGAAAARLKRTSELETAGASSALAAVVADSIWEDAERRLESPAKMAAMLEPKTPEEAMLAPVARAVTLAEVAASLERDLDKLHAKLVTSTKPFDMHRMAHIRQVIEMFKQFRRGRPGFEVLYGNINQDNKSIVQGTPNKEENLKLYDRAFAVYERLSQEEKDELFIADIIHDIGFALSERELDHWGVGADAVWDVLPKYGVSDQTVIKNVSDIIRYHGKIADIGIDVLPGDFSDMSRGLWDSILIVTMMDSAGNLTRKEPFKPDNVLSTRFLSDLLYLHEAGVEMTPEVLLSFRLRSVNVPRAFALSRPGVLLSDEEAASLEEMVRGDMITTEAWSRYIRSYNWPLFLMMRNRRMSVMDIYKVLRLTACVAACRFEKTGVKAPVSFTHAGDDFTDAFYTRVLDSMNGLFSRSPDTITVDTVRAELDRSAQTSVFGIKVAFDGDKFMLDAPTPAPAPAAAEIPVTVDQKSFRFAPGEAEVCENIVKSTDIIEKSALKIFGLSADLAKGVRLRNVTSKHKTIVRAGITLTDGREAAIAIYMSLSREPQGRSITSHEANIASAMASVEGARPFVPAYGAAAVSNGRDVYTTEFIDGIDYSSLRAALENVCGITGLGGKYLPGSEGITSRTPQNDKERAVNKLVTFGLVSADEAGNMNIDSLRSRARELLISLDTQAIRTYFALQNALKDKVTLDDLRAENLVAKRIDGAWALKAVDYESWLLQKAAPARFMVNFEVFNESEDGATAGHMIKLYLLRGWYWSRLEDKSGFFDAAVSAFPTPAEGRAYLAEAASSLRTGNSPYFAPIIRSIDDYLASGHTAEPVSLKQVVSPAAVQQAMPEVPAAILEGKSGMPEGKDITIVAQRPGAWEVRDREGRTLWMKFGGAGEKYAYRLAEMAGVNVPPWRLVALKDIDFTGFEAEYEDEVSTGGYTPESKVLITRDVNTLRPDELVARGASGLEEMLTFFMWAHAVDVSYVNNTATLVIDGQKRYLTYDIHIDPSETAEYGLDNRIVLSGWQTLDPARMKKAIDRIESLDEKAMQRFAIESGLSENSAKYMSAGLTKRASRLRQYMAEAMRAAAEDERSAAVVLPVRMDGRNITPVFNKYNFLFSVIGESADDPSNVERKDRAIELINSVWEKLVSEMFSAKNAALFSKILDDEAFARKFALENNPYLGYLYVAVAKEEESMLDKLRGIETNIDQYPVYNNLSPDVRAALSGAIKYGEQYVAKMRARADSFDPQKGFPYKESQLVKKMEGMASSILSTPAAPVAGEDAKAVVTAQVEAAKGVISDLRWNVADWVITPEGEEGGSQRAAVDTATARKFRKDYGSETMIRGYSYDKKFDDKKLSENFTAVLEKVLTEMSDPKFSARKPRAIMYVPADKYELAKQALAAIVQGPTDRITIIKESEMPANGVVDEVMHVVLGKGLLNAQRLRKGDFGLGETLDPAATDRLIKFLATIAVDLPTLADGRLEPGIIDKILDGIASLKMRPIDFTEIKEWKVAQDEVLRSL